MKNFKFHLTKTIIFLLIMTYFFIQVVRAMLDNNDEKFVIYLIGLGFVAMIGTIIENLKEL